MSTLQSSLASRQSIKSTMGKGVRQPIKNMLKFDGQWRSYQQRVLDRADNYFKDNRIHIVAAPGSGKTTLGIELIRRLNAPALILSPSINIRNQWLQRIEDAFLPEGTDTERILSDSIKKPALITAITYQALHSCMNPKKKVKRIRRRQKSMKTG